VIKIKILCLDNATKICGYAIFEDKELITYGTLKSEKNEKNPMIRIEQIYNKIKDVVLNNNIKYIVFEDTMFIKNIDTLKQLCQLQGCIMALCYDKNIGFHMFLPNEWRKHLGFKGRKREEQKQQAIDFVNDKYNLNLEFKLEGNDDKAEAISIGVAFYILVK
jgi:Holliday junction resolvasome RuvABC endonuclease subunit